MSLIPNLQVLINCMRKPQRLYNLGRYLVFKSSREPRSQFLPFVLDVEPTSYCNFKCEMCHVSSSSFPHRHMSFGQFQHIVDSNPQLIKIHLQGMGEPLLCPDFYEMVQYARKNHILVQTTTNGSLITESAAQQMANLGLRSIGISIDGATGQTFEAIRKNSDFYKVLKGTKYLASALSVAQSSTKLRAWCVFQQKNRHEAPDIVELCKKLGFHELVFQVFVSSWGKEEWDRKNKQIAVPDSNDDRFIGESLERGREIGLPVKVYDGNTYSHKNPCLWPWYSAFISASGDVVPCCILGDPSLKNFGKLSEARTLKDIWESEGYNNFRKCHLTRSVPDYCSRCYNDI